MPRLVPLLLLALLLSAAAPARAGLTQPNATVQPAQINLVGYGAAGPDSARGQFTVTVRDLAGNLVVGTDVVVDFSGTPDVRIAADQRDSRLTVGCAGRTVLAFTGADGRASFTILGGSYARAGTPGPCRAKVYVWGVLVGNVPVATYDMNGATGVMLADLAWFSADYFAETNPGRSDFNGDGVVSLADLALWSATYFAGGSSQSAASYCP